MRFHVLGLPHTSTTEANQWCAFTNDVQNFCTMMWLRGHEVFLYAGPKNDALVTEHIPCITKRQQKQWFGKEGFANRLTPDNLFDESQPWWVSFNGTTIAEITKRIEPSDIICTIVGKAHAAVVDAFPDHTSVEWAVGFPAERRHTRFANYVSYAWRNHCEGRRGMCFLQWWDSVIPMPFDDEGRDIAFERQDQDYLLFIGRKNESKGLHIANDIAVRSGRRLIVAGAGLSEMAPDAEHVGVVTGAAKSALISGAHALLVPSVYAEPFGKVVIEAHLRGVPTLTSDFGAFPETVLQGLNGSRCRTMMEFLAAVDTEYAPPEQIADHARAMYTYDEQGAGVVGEMYERWFERLQSGWYPD